MKAMQGHEKQCKTGTKGKLDGMVVPMIGVDQPTTKSIPSVSMCNEQNVCVLFTSDSPLLNSGPKCAIKSFN